MVSHLCFITEVNILNVFDTLATGLQPEQFALEDGWSFLNRQRDEIDDEWQTFTECIQRDVFWLMGHVLISELVRFVFPKVSDS